MSETTKTPDGRTPSLTENLGLIFDLLVARIENAEPCPFPDDLEYRVEVWERNNPTDSLSTCVAMIRIKKKGTRGVVFVDFSKRLALDFHNFPLAERENFITYLAYGLVSRYYKTFEAENVTDSE